MPRRRSSWTSPTLVALVVATGLALTLPVLAAGATFPVDDTADAVDANPGDGLCADAAGKCTLRAAIQEAHALHGTHAIDVAPGLYLLTLGGIQLPDGTVSLTIAGVDAATTIIDGQDQHPIFGFSDAKVSLRDLTLQRAAGDAVNGGDELTITRCRIVDSVKAISSHGGTNPSELWIYDSEIEGPIDATRFATKMTDSTLRGTLTLGPLNTNEITNSSLLDGSLEISTIASLTIKDSHVEDFPITVRHATMEVIGSTVTRSGIGISQEGSVGVSSSTLTGSPGCAVGGSGSVGVVDSVVSDNGCGVSAGGAQAAHLSVVRSTIRDNAGIGVSISGGAFGVAQLTIRDSSISGNDGGGVLVDDGNVEPSALIENSTIAGNTTSGNGGGIHIPGSELDGNAVELRNVTISGNHAEGSGGGIFASGGTLSLSNVTITDNVADSDDDGNGDGGGIAVTTATVTARNTLIGANVDEGGEAHGCAGSLISDGYNLLMQPVGCVIGGDTTGNVLGVDPILDELADNGGPTATHAIDAASPAFGAGDPAGCTRDDGALLATDQRGVTRPQLGGCDIGAFELACGNGTVDVGETCDDGGGLDGDCCSARCQLEENGSACNDGNACTVGNTCTEGVCGGGTPLACNACETCVPSAGCVANVRTGCDQPSQRFSGELSFTATGTPKLKWHWAKGGAATLGDFGDPLGDDVFAFCVFDESGMTPTVLFGAQTRAGTCGKKPCWKQPNASSLQYRDPELSPDGLHGILLKAGPAGRSRALLTGKGSALDLPALPLRLPLRAQLQADNGRCWEGRYFDVGVQRNDGKAFKAKAYRP